MPISHRQMEELTNTEYRNTLELFADKILPVTDPNHLRVLRVAKRLVMANGSKEMEHLSWQVNVVTCDDMNAFVLPVSLPRLSSFFFIFIIFLTIKPFTL